MKTSKKDFLLYLFSFVMIICFGCLSFRVITETNSLDKNRKYTYAVIVDFHSGARLRYYFDYTFSVDGKEYHGDGRYYPKSDTLSIGDSVRVVYDKMNPDNNRGHRDYKSYQKNKPFIIPVLILIALLAWWKVRKK